MSGILGGYSGSFYRIDVLHRGASSVNCPASPEARKVWLDEYKQEKENFRAWQKINRYRIEGFPTREQAEDALLRFKTKPPCRVEIVQYSYL
jgi:hypothetical protein